MVDINLFKDEEEGQELPSTPENLDDEALDGLDDFDFDEPLDDLDEVSLGEDSLDDDSDLLIEEPLPDLDDELAEDETDYAYGDVTAKKTPVWVWGAIAIALILVALYIFVIQPRLSKPYPTVTAQKPVQTTVTPPGQGAVKDSSAMKTPEEKPESSSPVTTAPRPVVTPPAEGVGDLTTYVNTTKKVIQNFTGSSQFAGLFLSGSEFFAVEYASRSKGVGQAMAHRVKTLLGVDDVKISPEEGHRTAGTTMYYGVISGKLSQAAAGSAASGKGAVYASANDFVKDIRALASRTGFSVAGLEKIADRKSGAKQQVDYRIKLNGSQAAVNSLLHGLSGLGGNAFVVKMTMAPSRYNDFKASDLKITLEYRVIH